MHFSFSRAIPYPPSPTPLRTFFQLTWSLIAPLRWRWPWPPWSCSPCSWWAGSTSTTAASRLGFMIPTFYLPKFLNFHFVFRKKIIFREKKLTKFKIFTQFRKHFRAQWYILCETGPLSRYEKSISKTLLFWGFSSKALNSRSTSCGWSTSPGSTTPSRRSWSTSGPTSTTSGICLFSLLQCYFTFPFI